MKINKQNKSDKEVSIVYGDDNSISVNIFNNKILMEVVGSFNSNLKELEKITGSKIYFRGNSITCKGDKEKLSNFCDAIKFLINKYLLTNIIEKEDIVLSVKKNIEIEESNVKSFKQLIKTPIQTIGYRYKNTENCI